MRRELGIKKIWSGAPVLLFAGTAFILLPIIAFLTLESIHRQEQNMVRLLVEKGAALIRSFEAGTRTGMMGGWMGGGFRLQHLLAETARQPDILYLMVTDAHGVIQAHSDPERIGSIYSETVDYRALADTSAVQWRWLSEADGREVFEVYGKFTPTPRPQRGREGPGRGGFRMHHMPPSTAEPPLQFIFIGLDPDAVVAAQGADTRHTVVMGAILLFVGLASVFVMLLAQGYRTARASLSRIKAFSDHLVENMPIGLLALDTRHMVVSSNPAALALLGLPRERVDGKPAAQVLPEELWQEVRLLEKNSGVIEREMVCTLKGGSRMPINLSGACLLDADGSFLGCLLLLKDLRELHALRKEILRNQRLASVGRLAAGVAHEVRNPLSSIKGFATYFRDRYRDRPEDQQIADIMIQEVDRLNRVIGQLLDFARPIKISKRPVSMADLIADSLKLVEDRARQQNVDLKNETAPELETVRVDADRISQVLLNLYLNALDAMDGGGRLEVKAVRATEAGAISLSVADSGHGIGAEQLSQVFDPYFTTKPTGTGLGLAIVHNIVEAHGGRIAIQSVPGQGTTFTVTLPDAQGKPTHD